MVAPEPSFTARSAGVLLQRESLGELKLLSSPKNLSPNPAPPDIRTQRGIFAAAQIKTLADVCIQTTGFMKLCDKADAHLSDGVASTCRNGGCLIKGHVIRGIECSQHVGLDIRVPYRESTVGFALHAYAQTNYGAVVRLEFGIADAVVDVIDVEVLPNDLRLRLNTQC
jgi:hypothetical protein